VVPVALAIEGQCSTATKRRPPLTLTLPLPAGHDVANQERLAKALAIEKMYGDAAPTFVAERIGALELTGDAAGVQRWQEIAAKLDQLRRPTSSDGITQS
jgi:hypothetical protein